MHNEHTGIHHRKGKGGHKEMRIIEERNTKCMSERKMEGKEEKYDKPHRIFPEQGLFLFGCNTCYIKIIQ